MLVDGARVRRYESIRNNWILFPSHHELLMNTDEDESMMIAEHSVDR